MQILNDNICRTGCELILACGEVNMSFSFARFCNVILIFPKLIA